MDTLQDKMEEATRVGRALVRELLPHGDDYVKSVIAEVGIEGRSMKQAMLRMRSFMLKKSCPEWEAQAPALLTTCNYLIFGCLYSAMHISQMWLDEETATKVHRYLELNFFDSLDRIERGPPTLDR